MPKGVSTDTQKFVQNKQGFLEDHIVNRDVGSKTTLHYTNQVVIDLISFFILSCFGTNVPHYKIGKAVC